MTLSRFNLGPIFKILNPSPYQFREQFGFENHDAQYLSTPIQRLPSFLVNKDNFSHWSKTKKEEEEEEEACIKADIY